MPILRVRSKGTVLGIVRLLIGQVALGPGYQVMALAA
jgi:hypothetical protein